MTENSRAAGGNSGWRLVKWLDDNFEKIFLISGLLAIVFLITWQVLYRYVFIHLTAGGKGADWAEEIARYIFIWISYLAVPVAIKRNDLIRVDIVYDRLPERFKKMAGMIVDMSLILWSAVIMQRGYFHVARLVGYATESPVMHIPYWLLYAILPLGFLMILIRSVQDMVKRGRDCGLRDSVIAVITGFVLVLPALLELSWSVTLYLFGYFFLLLVLGVPIAMALGQEATVLRDGVVVDYAGALRIVKALKEKLEKRLGRELPYCAIAMPAHTESSVKTHRYVAEGAGFTVTNIVDEPSAANAVYQIQNGVVVDVGGGTTGLAILEHGAVVQMEDEPTGGTHVTLVISGSYKVSFEEAEQMKRNPEFYGQIFPVVKPVFEKMASIVNKYIDKTKVETIYLCGGTCCLAGVEAMSKSRPGPRASSVKCVQTYAPDI